MIDEMINRMLKNWGFDPKQLQAQTVAAFSKVDGFEKQIDELARLLIKTNIKLNLLLEKAEYDTVKIDADIDETLKPRELHRTDLIPPSVHYNGKA